MSSVGWLVAGIALALGSCDAPSSSVSDARATAPYGDQYYYRWDGPGLLCGIAIDFDAGLDLAEVKRAIQWAKRERSVFVLYGHKPKELVAVATITSILEAGTSAGVPFLAFQDLVDGAEAPRAGIALTFDDDAIPEWHELRELLARHDARATFFVTRPQFQSPASMDLLRELRDDGHSIENHGRLHRKAADYVAAEGIDSYLAREFLPALQTLQDEGFTPTSFAYPFGSYTQEIDRALAPYAYFRRGNARCPRDL